MWHCKKGRAYDAACNPVIPSLQPYIGVALQEGSRVRGRADLLPLPGRDRVARAAADGRAGGGRCRTKY
eukprot:scaffold54624_cov60-Phaeocystis_antarctica.AAC.2